MKKVILFSTICILASAQCGGGKSYASNPVMPLWAIPSPFISTAATPDDGDVTKPSTDNDDDDIISYKIGAEDLSGNGAELTWDKAHGTFTVIGHGDISQIQTQSNTREFTKEAVGNIYIKNAENYTSVKVADTYNKSQSYYFAKRTYSNYVDEGNTITHAPQTVYTSFTEKGIADLYIGNWYAGTTEQYVKITSNDTPRNVNGIAQKGVWMNWNGDNMSRYYIAAGKDEDGKQKYKQLTIVDLSSYMNSEEKDVYTYVPDNIFTKVGDNYYQLVVGDDYQKGATYYTPNTTTYEKLTKETDANAYTTPRILPFYDCLEDFLVTGSGVNYTKVVFSTSASLIADNVTNKKYATIDDNVCHALFNISSIKELDLQDVAIQTIKVPYADTSSHDKIVGTFSNATHAWTKNESLTTLYTPRVLEENYTLGKGAFENFTNLKKLFMGEGIVTLDEQSLATASGGYHLESCTFPNTLKSIKSKALTEQYEVMTWVFPEGLKEIEKDAFFGCHPKDVFFLGKEAPKVAAFAWGDDAYAGNNGFTTKVTDNGVVVDQKTGYACRSNYINGSAWQTMLHYPSACTKEQAAKYTDITREYRRIVYDANNQTTIGSDGNGESVTPYTPGKETVDLKGGGSTTNHVAKKTFYAPTSTANGTFSGSYSGGYYDMYTHDQYLWPSQAMILRATITGYNGVLWDGVSTIGDGIRNAAKEDGNSETSSFEGDGKEYIGLHQFVHAKNDVSATRTDEFDLSKYVDGKWHTICLSFDMTKYDMKQVFGKSKDENGNEVYNIRLCKFDEVVRVSDKGEKYIHLKFNDEKFASANDAEVVLEAHQSYMIKAKKEQAVDGGKLTKAVMRNYVAKPGNPEPTEVYSHDGKEAQAQADYPYRFIGTYFQQIYMPQYSYFFSKNKGTFRFQTGQKGKWNTNTSIIEAPEGERDYQELFANMDEKANAKTFTSLNDWSNYSETTGIGGIVIESGDEVISTTGKVYNLSGQLVSRHGIEGLPKGIYIIGGKKLSVK